MAVNPHTYDAWGIELQDSDRWFLVGIGFSPHLKGQAADYTHVVKTLTFASRSEARSALASYRKTWAFTGMDAIFTSGRVARLRITVDVV